MAQLVRVAPIVLCALAACGGAAQSSVPQKQPETCLVHVPAEPPNPQNKERDLAALLEVMHFDTMVQTMVGQFVEIMKKKAPELTPDFFRIFEKDFTVGFVRSIAIPAYERHYTQEEIVAMTAFYASDVGQSTLAKMPALMQETMTEGAEWGRRFAEREVARWRDEHATK